MTSDEKNAEIRHNLELRKQVAQGKASFETHVATKDGIKLKKEKK